MILDYFSLCIRISLISSSEVWLVPFNIAKEKALYIRREAEVSIFSFAKRSHKTIRVVADLAVSALNGHMHFYLFYFKVEPSPDARLTCHQIARRCSGHPSDSPTNRGRFQRACHSLYKLIG